LEEKRVKEYVRQLPPIHEIQRDNRFQQLVSNYKLRAELVTELIQVQIQRVRNELLAGNKEVTLPSRAEFIDELFRNIENECMKVSEYYLQPVINATGTVLHTNLGRARLSEEAIEQVVNVARNYTNLEYNLSTGKRGSRHDIIEDLIKRVTGAESAMVVNNNAAAVYLILRAFAKDKNVIVSRGQLVEIGGSFRVSSIMEESGANLIEIGTTNKTHLYDYENAIDENTAMIMKVHTSNFKTIGFTKTVESEELAALCDLHEGVIFYEDLGSGSLYDFRGKSIGEEPVVEDILAQGIDIVSFSGDKLLGGPQAGIIAGKKKLIDKLKKHQLARVLRVDKMTFAALEATLKAYLQDASSIPTVRDIIEPTESIKERAERFVTSINELALGYECEVKQDFSQVGGGTMPDVLLPTYVVTFLKKDKSAETIATLFRKSKPSIITRVKNDQIILDFRTITNEELNTLIEIVKKL
jgi:L-seryl-tRNA(Ser) seleniumtransferase